MTDYISIAGGGNSSGDDTAAFQAALDAGATQKLPVKMDAKTYYVRHRLNFRDNCVLFGVHPALSVIKGSGFASAVLGGINGAIGRGYSPIFRDNLIAAFV